MLAWTAPRFSSSVAIAGNVYIMAGVYIVWRKMSILVNETREALMQFAMSLDFFGENL
jgi:hypothetical protein